MTDIRTLHRSFAGGEITPEMFGRSDLLKYQTGLALCRNCMVLPHGAVINRPGSRHIIETKFSNTVSRLIPFSFSEDVTYILEFGGGYIRFHTNSGTVVEPAKSVTDMTATNPAVLTVVGHGYAQGDWIFLTNAAPGLDGMFWKVGAVLSVDTFELQHLSGGDVDARAGSPIGAFTGPGEAKRVYEIVAPYIAEDTPDIHYAQANDTLTLVHPLYAQRELVIAAPTSWSLNTINFDPAITHPTGVAADPTVDEGTDTAKTYRYVVTAATKEGEESFTAVDVQAANRLWVAGNLNTISWVGVTGADFYNIYKTTSVVTVARASLGFIGRTTATAFIDDNIAPDYSTTIPTPGFVFPGAGDFPAAVSYFEQRRAFGGTINQPQNIWLTRSGSDSNMARSFPVRADDSIEFRIASRELNTVKHIVAVDDLLLFTDSVVWRVWSQDSDALTPTTISVRVTEFIGASNVQPVTAGGSVLFEESRGGHVYEVKYQWEKSGYAVADMSIMAPHLFDGFTLRDMAPVRAPYKVIWAPRSDGKLLGLTYVPQHNVAAWHQHDTAGEYESIATVPEGAEDGVYAVVKREINGRTVRNIERFASPIFSTLEDCFYVDAGLTYSGAPATEIRGLNHLEGMPVSILADGAVVPQRVVEDGMITLESAASKVHVGLPITAQFQTLPLVHEASELGQDVQKNVAALHMRVRQSSSLFAGPDFDSLREFKQRTDEDYGTPPREFTGLAEITLDGLWNTEGQVCVEQSQPLPLTALSMTLAVALGDY